MMFMRLRVYHPPFTANPASLEYDPSPYPLSARRCFLRGKNVVAPCQSYWLYNSVSTRKPNLFFFLQHLNDKVLLKMCRGTIYVCYRSELNYPECQYI